VCARRDLIKNSQGRDPSTQDTKENKKMRDGDPKTPVFC
jgi:hypothetical protein